MRLTRTVFDVRIEVADDGRIILSTGLIAGELSPEETIKLGHECADAYAQFQRIMLEARSGGDG
jgi:hypothetical protein